MVEFWRSRNHTPAAQQHPQARGTLRPWILHQLSFTTYPQAFLPRLPERSHLLDLLLQLPLLGGIGQEAQEE